MSRIRLSSKLPSSGHTAIVHVPTRKIPDNTRIQLFVRAGGRCEFDGCNEFLLEHHVTRRRGVFGEMAHVVAFRQDGPRGAGRRPSDINNVDNLMLLCARCHKLVDDNPLNYSRHTLQEYKANHETRIKHVTALGPERSTAVLIFRALIGGQTASIPFDQIVEATAPRYPLSRQPFDIDLTGIQASGAAFYKTACDTIRNRVADLLKPEGEGSRTGHISVFAMGPMPLLIFLGRRLSNKIATQIYQRHRDTESWNWNQGRRPVDYTVRQIRRGRTKDRVAVIMSLSGKIRIADLPYSQRKSSSIYELTLRGQTPRPTYLKSQKDLETFKLAYQQLLGQIINKHGLIRSIDLFPAVPAPVAVLCGRELMPNVHPSLRVFDYDKHSGEYTFQMEV